MELIPRKKPQKITYEQFQENTPEKLEMYENNVFFDEQQRLKMLKLLLTNVGIESLVKNLPMETRKELLETLEDIDMERKCLEIIKQEVLNFAQVKIDHEHKFDKQNKTLYIFIKILDTGTIWSVSYTYNKETEEFMEKGRFHAFACEDTLRRLLDR